MTTLVSEQAELAGVFVVGHSHGLQGLYRYYVDAPGALTMQTLTELTRVVSVKIDELELGDTPFTFEISSPGADKPLTDIRQFPKHTGRTFSLELKSGDSFDAVLTAVNDSILVFEKTTTTKDKGKKVTLTESLEIPLESIENATIKLVFK